MAYKIYIKTEDGLEELPISADGAEGSSITPYGVSSTVGSTSTKSVTISVGDFSLTTGARVSVKFTYKNTATSVYLNVASTGAKLVKFNGMTNIANVLLAGAVYDFVYDGSYWNLIGTGIPYPIGAIYMSTNNTSPASFYGGTWTAIQDKFLIGAGSSYTVLSSGGSTSHSHDSGDMTAKVTNRSSGMIIYEKYAAENWTPNQTTPAGTGSSPSTSETQFGSEVIGTTGETVTLPPYYAVYMWRRTA